MKYVFKPGHWSSHGVILRWTGQGFGRRLLDLGAGSGALAYRLEKREWKVTTIDCDGEPDVWADLDIPERPKDLGAFDTVVCADVLEHLVDPEDVLRWIASLLLIEGRLLVSVPNVAHLSTRLGLLAGRWDTTDRGILDETHLHFYTRRTARELLEAAGFKIIRETATPAPVSLVLRGWPAIADRVHAWLARTWPTLLGYQSIFLCEKERTKVNG